MEWSTGNRCILLINIKKHNKRTSTWASTCIGVHYTLTSTLTLNLLHCYQIGQHVSWLYSTGIVSGQKLSNLLTSCCCLLHWLSLLSPLRHCHFNGHSISSLGSVPRFDRPASYKWIHIHVLCLPLGSVPLLGSSLFPPSGSVPRSLRLFPLPPLRLCPPVPP